MKGEVKAVDAGLSLDETTCCVCLESLKAPRVLTCGHHVCLQCTQKITNPSQHYYNNNNISNNNNIHPNNLTNYTNTSNSTNTNYNTNYNINEEPMLRCPQCHTPTKVQDLHEEVKSQINAVAVLCGVCEKEPATRECLNCAKPEVLPLCLDCSAPIHKGRMMSSHTVNLLGASPRKPHVERCTTHRKKKTLFCMDDTSLVCGHCMLDNHKGHNAVPVSSAAMILLPKLQERVTNLPAVHHELKSIVTKLDGHINEMFMERTNQEQYLATAISEILGAIEETRGVLQERIRALFTFQESLALRAKTTSQIAIINTFKSGGIQVENLEEMDVVRLFCSLSELNKVDRVPKPTKLRATKIATKSIVDAIYRLPALPFFNCIQQQELIISRRVELDLSKQHSYSLVRIEKGGILTSTPGSPLVLNVQVLEIEAEGSIDLNGKGYVGGASIANDSKGFANQGASPIGGGGRSGSANGGGGGGGQGGGNFGSTGGGGGGYGTVGSFGVHNIGSPGGSAGNTYGAPDLTVLEMGSGGGSGHPFTKGTGGRGGNGGGALRINAWTIINNGTILCNGEDGKAGLQSGSGGGGGSGGSIYLQADNFENRGKITATGGQGGVNLSPSYPNICSKGGSGGYGRIRVDLPKNTNTGNIVPYPFAGYSV